MNEQNKINTEKSQEDVKDENKKMIRSCIIGLVVIILFTGVYFLAGGRGETEEKKNTQTEQKIENKDISGNEEKDKTSDEQDNTDSVYEKYNIKYTRDEALKEAESAAKKQFGEDAIVIPASDETPTEVEIDGNMHPCYMFGADSMSHLSDGNESLRGLYHFDASTGEIFDNADGKMKKIN